MPATEPLQFGRTVRSADSVRADAQAARDYWTALEHLSAARRAAILRERTQPTQRDEQSAGTTESAQSESFVFTMPAPRLGPAERESALERRERHLWLERVEHPTHQLLRRLRTERDKLEREVSEQGKPPPRYVRGEIHPSGMTYQRALAIAIACLEREAELNGAANARPTIAGGPVAAPTI